VPSDRLNQLDDLFVVGRSIYQGLDLGCSVPICDGPIEEFAYVTNRGLKRARTAVHREVGDDGIRPPLTEKLPYRDPGYLAGEVPERHVDACECNVAKPHSSR